MAYWVNDEHYDAYIEWLNELFDDAPDQWDYDEAQESLLTRWVQHLVEEVKLRGGCLRPWCMHNEGEECDHGYLDKPAPHWCTPGCDHPPIQLSDEAKVRLAELLKADG